MVELIGSIQFDNVSLNVYNSLENPIFRAIDITNAIGIPREEFTKVFSLCEKDELLYLPKVIDDYSFSHIYMSEAGLYDVLSQSRSPIARKWRRIIIKELIKLRQDRGYNIVEQFDEWDHRLDDIYFDEETGELMETSLAQGGDTYQSPYCLDEESKGGDE
jgi:prophage antirepressor-like protein